MARKKERGLRELYQKDPEKADAEIWGRKPETLSRRGFLRKSGLVAMSLAVGAQIPFFRNMPAGFIPEALAAPTSPRVISGKEGLTVLNDRPVNAEPPPDLLDDDTTPKEIHFVRNNGLLPEKTTDPDKWEIEIVGEVHKALKISLGELKNNFKSHSFALQIECGGNGRAGFFPSAKGNQWKFGAVGCSKYKGICLKDVLNAAGLKTNAVFTGYYGADSHLSGNPEKDSISRGTPIEKALEEHTLIAWEMNGEPLPLLHGYPVRLVTPGWPGSTSPKWLKKIWVRNQVHDGQKMDKYRVPRYPIKPGSEVSPENMEIIESMPVKSLITFPKTGITLKEGKVLSIRGHAWAGERSIKDVHLSYDFGATWIHAILEKPTNRYAWQHWNSKFHLPSKGYFEIWARATDSQGIMQPMVVPGWNPSGYINNAMHRIAVTVV